MSISEAAVPDLADISDLEDEEEVVERRNGEGGTKRKAAINKGKESDEDEKGAEESKAHQVLSGVEAFWKKKFSKVSPSGILISYFEMMLIKIQPVTLPTHLCNTQSPPRFFQRVRCVRAKNCNSV